MESIPVFITVTITIDIIDVRYTLACLTSYTQSDFTVICFILYLDNEAKMRRKTNALDQIPEKKED